MNRKHETLQRKALVLLSGGLDSAAVMHYAVERYESVAALAFNYGQPHSVETVTARRIAERRNVPFACLMIGEAVRGLGAIVPPEPGHVAPGVSRAVTPGRNLIFIAVAAAHGARTWPGDRFDVVIGANIDDTKGFADCRPDFISRAAEAVSFGLVGQAECYVRAPWIELVYTKADVVKWAALRPTALEDVRASLSCYHSTRCGKCDACTLRQSAFEAAGVSDSHT